MSVVKPLSKPCCRICDKNVYGKQKAVLCNGICRTKLHFKCIIDDLQISPSISAKLKSVIYKGYECNTCLVMKEDDKLCVCQICDIDIKQSQERLVCTGKCKNIFHKSCVSYNDKVDANTVFSCSFCTSQDNYKLEKVIQNDANLKCLNCLEDIDFERQILTCSSCQLYLHFNCVEDKQNSLCNLCVEKFKNDDFINTNLCIKTTVSERIKSREKNLIEENQNVNSNDFTFLDLSKRVFILEQELKVIREDNVFLKSIIQYFIKETNPKSNDQENTSVATRQTEMTGKVELIGAGFKDNYASEHKHSVPKSVYYWNNKREKNSWEGGKKQWANHFKNQFDDFNINNKLFVSRLEPSMTAKDVEALIRNKSTEVKGLQCIKLKNKNGKCSSFCIIGSEDLLEFICKPDIWPPGVFIRSFRGNLNSHIICENTELFSIHSKESNIESHDCKGIDINCETDIMSKGGELITKIDSFKCDDSENVNHCNDQNINNCYDTDNYKLCDRLINDGNTEMYPSDLVDRSILNVSRTTGESHTETEDLSLSKDNEVSFKIINDYGPGSSQTDI